MYWEIHCEVKMAIDLENRLGCQIMPGLETYLEIHSVTQAEIWLDTRLARAVLVGRR